MILGEETAQWTEHGDHHSRYEAFLQHEVLARVLPSPCHPGEYLYPFQYTLPHDVPGVLDADSLDGDALDALHATIKYTLKASIKVEGRFVSDLEASHALVVRDVPAPGRALLLPPALVPTQSVERTVSKRVRLFGCLSRGTCHVAASLKHNVLALGDTVRVDVFVNNHTSALAIQSVKCRVYQDVTLADPRSRNGSGQVCSRPLLQVKCAGPSSGELLERPIDLVLAGKLRFPSTTGRFLACSYRIGVECELRFAPPIAIDLPVTIVPAQGPLQPLPIERAPSSSAASSNGARATAAAYAAQQATPLAPASRTRGSSARPPPPPLPFAGPPSRPASASSSSASTASSTQQQQPFAHLVAAPPAHPQIDLMA